MLLFRPARSNLTHVTGSLMEVFVVCSRCGGAGRGGGVCGAGRLELPEYFARIMSLYLLQLGFPGLVKDLTESIFADRAVRIRLSWLVSACSRHIMYPRSSYAPE
jgi:hypothetical protein